MATKKRFEEQFEFHKIPEFYDHYFKYSQLKQHVKSFKQRLESNSLGRIMIARIRFLEASPSLNLFQC